MPDGIGGILCEMALGNIDLDLRAGVNRADRIAGRHALLDDDIAQHRIDENLDCSRVRAIRHRFTRSSVCRTTTMAEGLALSRRGPQCAATPRCSDIRDDQETSHAGSATA